ncbi:MAG: hypothetical protein ACR2RE_19880, partial [Geminicoccaceae bacterium]
MSAKGQHKQPRRRTKVKETGAALEVRRARTRLRLLSVLGVLGFVALGARLTDLAVMSPGPPVVDHYVAKPEENQTRR